MTQWRFGISMSVLAATWNRSTAERSCQVAADAGCSAVELPIQLICSVKSVSLGVTKDILRRAGLLPICTLRLDAEEELGSPDARSASRGLEKIAHAVDIAAAIGSELISGVLYGPIQMANEPVTAEYRRRLIKQLQAAADIANDSGVRLAIEPVNRYESNVVNTAHDALELVVRIDRGNVGLLLDTFHMGIEEYDPVLAIASVLEAGKLFHFQIAGPGRGTLTPTVVASSSLRVLSMYNYDGCISFETFSAQMPDPTISYRVANWRAPWTSGEEVIRGAMKTLAEMVRELGKGRPDLPHSGHAEAVPALKDRHDNAAWNEPSAATSCHLD